MSGVPKKWRYVKLNKLLLSPLPNEDITFPRQTLIKNLI